MYNDISVSWIQATASGRSCDSIPLRRNKKVSIPRGILALHKSVMAPDSLLRMIIILIGVIFCSDDYHIHKERLFTVTVESVLLCMDVRPGLDSQA